MVVPIEWQRQLALLCLRVGMLVSTLVVFDAFAETNCVAPPDGLVGWWRAEGTAADQAGTNHGTLVGTTFGSGEVGQAFVFDGSGDAVTIGNPPELQLQTFTIEAWVKRFNGTRISLDF